MCVILFQLTQEDTGVGSRCSLPHRSLWPRSVAKNFPLIPGAFVNMTPLAVPAYVASYLSLGPKFMLPSFGKFTNSAVTTDFNTVLASLRSAGCMEAVREPNLTQLRSTHATSLGAGHNLSLGDQRVLYQAQAVEEYLELHSDVMVVEGDKGKKVGLISRQQFDEMCMKFLLGGVRAGQYKLRTGLNVKDYQIHLKEQYDVMVQAFHPNTGAKHLYLSLGEADVPLCDGRNRKVHYVLSHAEWRMPMFIPTVKYHKTPLSLRPVVSKKGSASVAVGRVICEALTRIRYVIDIYVWYNLMFCVLVPIMLAMILLWMCQFVVYYLLSCMLHMILRVGMSTIV